MSPVNFKDGLNERPKCEKCGKPALRAIPMGKGVFKCLCQKCYTEERERPMLEKLKREMIEELKKDYELVPKVKKDAD